MAAAPLVGTLEMGAVGRPPLGCADCRVVGRSHREVSAVDPRRFDDIARRWSTNRSRRQVVRLAVEGVAGGWLARLGLGLGLGPRDDCREAGSPCGGDDACCSSRCRDGRCQCPPDRSRCGESCCAVGERCRDGRCERGPGADGDRTASAQAAACPAGRVRCRGRCCPTGERCRDGRCTAGRPARGGRGNRGDGQDGQPGTAAIGAPCDAATPCDPGERCCSGVCRQCCGTFHCPTGQRCCNFTCRECCANNQCPAGQRCCGGRCQQCCTNAQCPTGQTCQAGSCAGACPTGQRDCNGTCQQCCNDADCGNNERCAGGTCEPNPTCPEGERDCDGTCRQCCQDAHCADGETCQNGTCQGPGGGGGVRVRRSIHGLGGGELDAFKAGVEVMKARPANDPTSWIYQAEMHGVIGDRCQHNTFFFFSWHRMYIYWFERILRRAAQSRFPNSDVALPYWNYAVAAQRALPEPFRQPADPAANPLYAVERGQGVNAGAISADLTIYDHAPAFAQANFFHTVNGGISFGGMVATAPTHTGPGRGGRGLIENMPHGGIHNWVGGTAPNGSPGLMATIRFAPRDPIFWLHHSNLDRLWQRWLDLGGGRQNPVGNPDWMGDRFTFWNEDGQAVMMTGQEVVDTAAQLDYRYDDDPVATAARTARSTEAGTARSAGRRTKVSRDRNAGGPAAEATTLLGTGTAPKRITVGRAPAVVPLSLKGPLPDLRGKGERGRRARSVVLTIEGLRGEGVASAAVGVYLNLPKGARPTPRGDSFVGTLSLFGIQPWDAAAGHGGGHGGHGGQAGRAAAPADGASQSFDVTRLLAALQRRRDWSRRVTVTLVAVDLSGGPLPAGPVASIERVILRTDRPDAAP